MLYQMFLFSETIRPFFLFVQYIVVQPKINMEKAVFHLNHINQAVVALLLA